MKTITLLLAVASFALSLCAADTSPAMKPAAPATVAETLPLTKPGTAPAPASGGTSQSYNIANTDILNIVVYDEPDLSIRSRVDAQGNVNLNLVDRVKVAGLSVADAQKAIEKAYQDARLLRAPQVTINIESYATREVSIQGQVRAPGRYPLPVEQPMTVVELVTKAGGFTDTAKGSSVKVTRIGPDGKVQTFTVDVKSIITGSSKSQVKDVVLEPGDNVFVEQSII